MVHLYFRRFNGRLSDAKITEDKAKEMIKDYKNNWNKIVNYDYGCPKDFLELIEEERAEGKMNMTVKEIVEKRLMMKGLVIELEDASNVFCEDSIAYQVLMERAEVERKELEAFDRKIFTHVAGKKVAE